MQKAFNLFNCVQLTGGAPQITFNIISVYSSLRQPPPPMHYNIGKLVTSYRQPHRLDTVMLTETLDNVAGYLAYGEVATILCAESKEGWVYVLGSKGRHGYIHFSNLKIIL